MERTGHFEIKQPIHHEGCIETSGQESTRFRFFETSANSFGMNYGAFSGSEMRPANLRVISTPVSCILRVKLFASCDRGVLHAAARRFVRFKFRSPSTKGDFRGFGNGSSHRGAPRPLSLR